MSVIKEYLVLYLSFSNVTKQKFLGSLFFDLSIGLITSETVPNWRESSLREQICQDISGWIFLKLSEYQD